jgi:hypothetical protein
MQKFKRRLKEEPLIPLGTSPLSSSPPLDPKSIYLIIGWFD